MTMKKGITEFLRVMKKSVFKKGFSLQEGTVEIGTYESLESPTQEEIEYVKEKLAQTARELAISKGFKLISKPVISVIENAIVFCGGKWAVVKDAIGNDRGRTVVFIKHLAITKEKSYDIKYVYNWYEDEKHRIAMKKFGSRGKDIFSNNL